MKYSRQFFFCVLAVGAVLAMSTATSAEPSDQPPASVALARSPDTRVSHAQVTAPSAAAASPGPAIAAQSSAETSSPILIVWAHTNLPDQGAPTLDVVDLERYFVNQLTNRSRKNVAPSATTKIPNPAAPNMYLIEVLVETMRPGKRSTWDDTMHRYDDHDILEVDLSLALKHSQSGRVVGTTGERHEHWFTSDSEWQRLVEKRAAIFKAADNLAGRFVDEWAAGKFGEDLPRSMVQSDVDKFIDQAKLTTGLSLPALAFLGVAAIVLLVALAVAARDLGYKRSRAYQAMQDALNNALMLALKTENFSDAACRAAAAARRDQILTAHAEVEKRAARLLRLSKHAEHFYAAVAKCAIRSTALSKAQVIETLRQADMWEFRVLQEAKKLAVEESK